MASANLTLRDVGAVCGVSAQAVGKWMNGQCLPRSSELVLFSKATGASLDWLMSPDDPFGQPFESMRAEYRSTIEAQSAEIERLKEALADAERQADAWAYEAKNPRD